MNQQVKKGTVLFTVKNKEENCTNIRSGTYYTKKKITSIFNSIKTSTPK